MIESIKSKIFLVLLVFLGLTIGNGLVSINYFNKLQKSIESIMYSNYDSVVAAQNMIEALERQDSLELTFIFEQESVLSKVYEENNIKFLGWLNVAKKNITENGEEEILLEIEKSYESYSDNVEKLEDLKNKEGEESVKTYYYNDILPLFEELKYSCSSFLDINQQSMVAMKDESKELAKDAIYYTLIILALVLIVGGCIIGYLLNKIIKPIEDLAIGIKMVSQGNYDYEIPLKRNKEINFVLEEFNHMIKQLKKYETLNVNEILREKQKAEEAEKLKSDFVATVSHEFRTPLTSISMAIGMLLENDANRGEYENELLTIIKDDSERLNNLVNELLDISKMESGKIEMEIQEFDINEVIKPIKNVFKIQLEEKKVKFNIDTMGVCRKIKVDINKISWVIINIVTNALRYINDDGSGTIEIRAREVNNNMLISICDNGKGISDDDQLIIFEKFVQLKNSDGAANGSSGLGLAISKEVVKAHGGEIWVDSILGQGSTFYFTLKLGGSID